MPAHAITLNLPASLYDHFQSRAKSTHRSLEAELLDAVASVADDKEDLLPDLADLALLSNDELRLAAQNRFFGEAKSKLDRLIEKQHSESLTPAEKEAQERLVQEYDRAVLLRAEALRLLKERGQDISELLTGR